jgi:hypothetical protein
LECGDVSPLSSEGFGPLRQPKAAKHRRILDCDIRVQSGTLSPLSAETRRNLNGLPAGHGASIVPLDIVRDFFEDSLPYQIGLLISSGL